MNQSIPRVYFPLKVHVFSNAFKMLAAGIVMAVSIVFSSSVNAQVYLEGHQATDRVFVPADNPYIVVNDYTIDPGVTLVIQPGVVVEFEYGKSIINNGTLVADGSKTERIVFRPKKDNPDLPQWNGIVFNGSKTVTENNRYVSGSVLSNADILSALYAVSLRNGTTLLIDSCNFESCSFGAIAEGATKNILSNNSFRACDYGVYLAGGFINTDNQITGNYFNGCNDVGIFVNSIASATRNQLISSNRIFNCNIGIHLGNYGLNGAGNEKIVDNIFKGNNTAIRLFHDSTQLKNNYFVENSNAVFCYNAQSNQIIENVLVRNTSSGINFRQGSENNTIVSNTFCDNANGITSTAQANSEGNPNTISYNSFYRNKPSGSVQIEDGNKASAQHNNIVGNGDLRSFVNISLNDIPADNSYWGTVNTAAIDSIILDNLDKPGLGEVIYKPYSQGEVIIAPILPPGKVIKQIQKNVVVVSYAKSTASDVSAYAVHYGLFNGWKFTNRVPNGKLLQMALPGAGINDTIAVTSIDTDADGIKDQPQGHESWYAYADLAPYAGPDTAICYNFNYTFSEANAINSDSVIWRTSGDGLFSDSHILNPIYNPGPADYQNSHVYLTLYAYSGGVMSSDQMEITFHDAPLIVLSADTTIVRDSVLVLSDLRIYGYNTIKWRTSGDGFFNAINLISPVYTPGVQDKLAGFFKLTCYAFSLCGFDTATIAVHLEKAYSLHGKIHAGGMPGSESSVKLYRNQKGEFVRTRSVLSLSDGSFEIKGLMVGEYFIYAVPDRLLNPGYLPTYYYSSINWNGAYKMPFGEETYDVDIDLEPYGKFLPEGAGQIKGICTQAAGSSEPCTDITVLLYDKELRHVFAWQHVINGGDFQFNALPFGDYKLVGEKSGIPVFTSVVLSVTPGHLVVGNVEMICGKGKYGFKFSPGTSPYETSSVTVYPNPCRDVLYITGVSGAEKLSVRVISMQGIPLARLDWTYKTDHIEVQLSDASPGLYFVEVWDAQTLVARKKIILL